MGCCGEREKGPPEQKQRWDFINLEDFKNTSFWTPLAYGWLWFMAFVGVAVYSVDTFTAVQLLVFDNWSSAVDPAIDIKYCRWIFAICIILSWVLLIYEGFRALRVIKRRGVAASYMDPIAMSLQSMRSQGWKRFLVFAELTKSKKGSDYVAFFVYFAFQGAIRVILCEGPRQVVNGMTVGSLFQKKLINQQETAGQSAIMQFFHNLQALANDDYQQVVILGSMCFTLIIWMFSAISLIAAGIVYVLFLWSYIPKQDARLRIYCRRKIDRRLEKIVQTKYKAAIEDELRKKEKEERKAELKRQKTGELPPPAPPKVTRQPTLPQLGESPGMMKEEDKFASLDRQDTNATVSTLPVYSSRPPTRQGVQRQPTLPDVAERPSMPARSATHASQWSKASFESDAPLLSNAGYAGGDGRVASPAPTYHSQRQNSNASSFNRRPLPGRNMSQSTQASQRSFAPVARMDTNGSQRAPPMPIRTNTSMSYEPGPPSATSFTTSPVDVYGRPLPPSARPGTADGYRPGPMRKDSEASYFSRPVAGTPGPAMDRRPTQSSLHSQPSFSRPMPRNPSQASTFHRPFTPAQANGQPTPPSNSYEMTTQQAYTPASAGPPSAGGYVAFNPGLSTPGPQMNGAPPRSATAPNANRALSSYDSILDDYGASSQEHGDGTRRPSPPTGPPRSYTAGPANGAGGWQQSRY